MGCLKYLRYAEHLNFSIFSLGFPLDVDPLPRLPQKVLLLDKIEHRKEFNGMSFELGGEVARQELKDVVAVHATCYEGYTKLLVLKACNAFYSDPYYHIGGNQKRAKDVSGRPVVEGRRTITKPLMFLSRKELLSEIKSLAFLALATNRSILLPNILIGVHRLFSST